MGGSSSGYRFTKTELKDLQQEAGNAARQGRLDAEVNALLSEQLIELNQRDREEISDRLAEIEGALKDDIEEFDRLLFGGSVAKHTYIDGLSDVDSLVVLRRDELAGETPAQILNEFTELLKGTLNMGGIESIEPGQLAVTINYRDGPEIQVLPATRNPDGELAISSASGKEWLTINPRSFAEKLTEVNKAQAGAVVPAIKLAKAMIANLPEDKRLSGYHAEALAVAAFDDYGGPRNPKAMLTHFFQRAAKNIQKPIADVTGQSRHVDEKLGGAGSQVRRDLGAALQNIANTMVFGKGVEKWRDLLGG